MKTSVVAAAILLGVTTTACARRVVLDPDVAAQRNGKEWIVKGEPGRAAATPKAPAPSESPKK